jgi:hypothetical protein
VTALSASRWRAEDIGLFLVLMIVANGAILPGLLGAPPLSRELLLGAFYLALFVHVAFTLYVGAFAHLRTATWLALIAAWAAATLAVLAAPLLPWTRDPALRAAIAALWPWLAFALLGIDLVAMHFARWRQRSLARLALFLAAVIVATIGVSVVLGWILVVPPPPAAGSGQGFAIVPEWHLLPIYALLRAVPDRMAGLIVAGAAVLVPMLWPWMRADVLRVGRARWAWRALCALLFATWIGLGYLGAQPPEGPALTAAQILAVFYFGYFLVSPAVLRRIARAS